MAIAYDRRTMDPNGLYLTDNGRALCGEHLGASARFTGCDISGQPIYRMNVRDVLESLAEGWRPCCERCGKTYPAGNIDHHVGRLAQ